MEVLSILLIYLNHREVGGGLRLSAMRDPQDIRVLDRKVYQFREVLGRRDLRELASDASIHVATPAPEESARGWQCSVFTS